MLYIVTDIAGIPLLVTDDILRAEAMVERAEPSSLILYTRMLNVVSHNEGD